MYLWSLIRITRHYLQNHFLQVHLFRTTRTSYYVTKNLKIAIVWFPSITWDITIWRAQSVIIVLQIKLEKINNNRRHPSGEKRSTVNAWHNTATTRFPGKGGWGDWNPESKMSLFMLRKTLCIVKNGVNLEHRYFQRNFFNYTGT